MKKLGLIILGLLIISTISAVEFNVKKEYSQGEAILTKISGSFQEPIKQENILLYRDHVRVAVNSQLSKIQEEYYLFVDLANKEPRNYSLVLQDVQYKIGAKVVRDNLTRNFTITNNFADFSINKGFITTEDDFSITVQNLKDSKINITYKFVEEKTVNLYSGEINELKISIKDAPDLTLKNLEISSDNTKYEIPVYVLDTSEAREPINFEFDSDFMNITLDLNNFTKRTLYLRNLGDETILKVKLSLSEELEKYITLSKTEILNLTKGFLYPVELTIFSGELPRTIKGEIFARSENIKDFVNISVKFFPGYVQTKEDLQASIKTCSDLGGVICSGICDGEETTSKEGACCLGKCITPTSSVWKTLGWTLLVIAVLFVGWIYFKKYKHAEVPAKGVFKLLKKD